MEEDSGMKKLVSLLVVVLMTVGMMQFASAAEPVELIWWMGCTSTAPVDQAVVEAELNKMSAELIGVTVKTTYFSADQIPIAMASGEYYDLVFTCGWYNDFNLNVQDGLFMNLDGLVQSEAPALWASMPEMLWQGAYATVGGQRGLFGVPNMKDYGIEVFFIIDKDYYVTEKGMEIPKDMKFADIEPYLEMYKKDYPDDYPMKIARDGLTSQFNFMDWISEPALISLSYAEQGTPNETKVQLCFEMPEYVDRLKLMHSWYEKGYINPDAAVTTSMPRANAGVVQSGQGFYGADTIWSNARQKASAISRYDGTYLSTYSLQGALTAVSAACKYPKEALKLLELMNTNADYRNMWRYGLEGAHYTKNEDGTVTKTKEGIDNYSVWPYTQGSYALSAVEASPFPSVPADPNMWNVVWDGYKNAVTSAALGFAFNYTSVQPQVNACSAIYDNYRYELRTGTSDPDVVLPQLIKELEDAGIRDVIAEAQKQLDEFLAAQAAVK